MPFMVAEEQLLQLENAGSQGAHQTRFLPYRWRSSRSSSISARNSSRAAKLPAMKAMNLATLLIRGEGNCET